MKPENHPEIRTAQLQFVLSFSITLLVIFYCSFFAITTAKNGIDILKDKHEKYAKVFQEQAAISFEVDELTKLVYKLKDKDRSLAEHRHLQSLITNARTDIEGKIANTKNATHFGLYKALLSQIKTIQSEMSTYKSEDEKYQELRDQLRLCISANS